MTRIALYQPDIPGNAGAFIRLAACMGAGLDVIEPCGFPWDEARIKRAAMDYFALASLKRHESWKIFMENRGESRIVLLTTRASTPFYAFSFQPDDILLAGSESAGVPDDVHNAADARITIPMQPGARSLNVVNAMAMVLGEAKRQTEWMCT